MDKKHIETIQSISVPIEQVENNIGQIPRVKANPREMTDEEFRKLKRSLQRNPEFTAISELRLFPFGGKYVTIGGNMRLKAMQSLGWKEVIGKPIPADTDPETLNRYILIDNANFGKWDFDKLANEWKQEMLADCNIDIPMIDEPKAEEEAEDDNADIDELIQEESDTRLGDLFQLGEHRLICGDSTESRYISALCDGVSVDCLLTDPPCGVNLQERALKRNNGENKGKIANDDKRGTALEDILQKAFNAISKEMKPGAAYYIWYANTSMKEFYKSAESTFGEVRQQLVWKKNNIVLGRQDYQWIHEPCLYGWKKGGSRYLTSNRSLKTILSTTAEDIEKMNKDEMRELLRQIYDDDICPKDVLKFNRPNKSKDHPTMKPVPLFGFLIKNSTRRGEVVADIFGGSGATLIAAEQLRRKCVMCELSPQYVDVIIRRWENLTGGEAKFIRNINEQTKQ